MDDFFDSIFQIFPSTLSIGLETALPFLSTRARTGTFFAAPRPLLDLSLGLFFAHSSLSWACLRYRFRQPPRCRSRALAWDLHSSPGGFVGHMPGALIRTQAKTPFKL